MLIKTEENDVVDFVDLAPIKEMYARKGWDYHGLLKELTKRLRGAGQDEELNHAIRQQQARKNAQYEANRNELRRRGDPQLKYVVDARLHARLKEKDPEYYKDSFHQKFIKKHFPEAVVNG